MITRYVNTASSAGGDGTTNAIIGANRAYASLNEFESSEQAVLSDSIEAICEGSAADGTKVIFDGWTTTASYYIYVHTTQANRHDGKWNAGKYRLSFSDAWDYVIDCNVNHIRIEGLQLYNSNADGYAFKYRGTGELYFSYNLLRGGANASNTNALHLDSMGASTVKIWNNILYNLNYGIFFGYGTAGSTFYIYNNTVVDITNAGIYITDAVGDCSLYLKNNLVFNTGDDYNVQNFTTQDYDYNMGEDAAFTGDANYVQTAQVGTAIFEDYNNDDFHIKTGSDAKDAGTNSVGPINFTDDIDGDTRSGSWDIGADEYVAPSTTAAPTTVPSTTLAPTTLPPTTLAPTSLLPTTLAPTTLPPTSLAPTTLAPTSLAPTTLAPTSLPPTTLPPTSLAPTTLPPTTLAPTSLPPTSLAPTTLAPTTQAPPTTLYQTTLGPTTKPPATTVAPTTLPPTTLVPTTLEPTTLAPTTLTPTTLAPTTIGPTTLPPTTIAPSTSVPTTTLTTAPPTTASPETICVKTFNSIIAKELSFRSPITKEIRVNGYLC